MYKDVSIYLAEYSTQQWKKSTQFNTTVTQATMALGWSLTKCKDLPVWVYDLTFVYIFCPHTYKQTLQYTRRGEVAKNLGRLATRLFKQRAPVHKKLVWISSQILFFKLEKGCGFLTLFFCLAHFSYLVSDITVLQTRFSPLPIGVHRNEKSP
jgi:hypothetical protein